MYLACKRWRDKLHSNPIGRCLFAAERSAVQPRVSTVTGSHVSWVEPFFSRERRLRVARTLAVGPPASYWLGHTCQSGALYSCQS